MKSRPKPVSCSRCAYNTPELCGYAKLRAEGKEKTLPEDARHGCRDFKPQWVPHTEVK